MNCPRRPARTKPRTTVTASAPNTLNTIVRRWPTRPPSAVEHTAVTRSGDSDTTGSSPGRMKSREMTWPTRRRVSPLLQGFDRISAANPQVAVLGRQGRPGLPRRTSTPSEYRTRGGPTGAGSPAAWTRHRRSRAVRQPAAARHGARSGRMRSIRTSGCAIPSARSGSRRAAQPRPAPADSDADPGRHGAEAALASCRSGRPRRAASASRTRCTEAGIRRARSRPAACGWRRGSGRPHCAGPTDRRRRRGRWSRGSSRDRGRAARRGPLTRRIAKAMSPIQVTPSNMSGSVPAGSSGATSTGSYGQCR